MLCATAIWCEFGYKGDGHEFANPQASLERASMEIDKTNRPGRTERVAKSGYAKTGKSEPAGAAPARLRYPRPSWAYPRPSSRPACATRS